MIETLVSILGVVGVSGAIGWVIQLGNRTSVLEARHEDMLLLINAKFDGISQRLARIELAMNGFLKDKH